MTQRNGEAESGILPWLASFGRRSARKLSPRKARLVSDLLPNIAVELDDVTAPNHPTKLAESHNQIWLEIGFGGGEHLAEQAQNNPDVLCIGCEPFIDGVAKLLVDVEEQGLSNVRILADDARLLLEALPDASLDRVFILFPDPWPKVRHHKRRIVNPETLDMLQRVIKPGGELRLATDHVDYATWMLEQVQAHDGFAWQAKRADDWKTAPADWVATRYETKTRAQGRAPVYYLLKRQ